MPTERTNGVRTGMACGSSPIGHHPKAITWKELFAIVAAVLTWGSFWSRQKILFHCDNQAVLDIWDRGSTRAPYTMGLVCLLYFVPVIIILMYVSLMSLVSAMILLTLCLVSRWTSSGSWLSGLKYCLTAYLHGLLRSS